MALSYATSPPPPWRTELFSALVPSTGVAPAISGGSAGFPTRRRIHFLTLIIYIYFICSLSRPSRTAARHLSRKSAKKPSGSATTGIFSRQTFCGFTLDRGFPLMAKSEIMYLLFLIDRARLKATHPEMGTRHPFKYNSSSRARLLVRPKNVLSCVLVRIFSAPYIIVNTEKKKKKREIKQKIDIADDRSREKF